jgi:hypothetical protein
LVAPDHRRRWLRVKRTLGETVTLAECFWAVNDSLL